MAYYETPNYSVAINAKVASSSMARAIIKQFMPARDWLIQTASYPPGQSADTRLWHWAVPSSETPRNPVVLLVREPVDRFATACQQLGISEPDVDSAINSIVNDGEFVRSKPDGMTDEEWAAVSESRRIAAEQLAAIRQRRFDAAGKSPPQRRRGRLRDDFHFFHQHEYVHGTTFCFQYPRDIAAAAAFVGITSPLPEANRARRPKPQLTAEQEEAVLAYYAADVALFNSITQPATVVSQWPPDE